VSVVGWREIAGAMISMSPPPTLGSVSTRSAGQIGDVGPVTDCVLHAAQATAIKTSGPAIRMGPPGGFHARWTARAGGVVFESVHHDPTRVRSGRSRIRADVDHSVIAATGAAVGPGGGSRSGRLTTSCSERWVPSPARALAREFRSFRCRANRPSSPAVPPRPSGSRS
jgi:hypothetical protein